MYDLVRGPFVWVAFAIFIFGLIFQAFRFYALTKRKDQVFLNLTPSPQKVPPKGFIEGVANGLISLKRTVWGTHPRIMVVTAIFHFCLIVTPFFVLGHNILLDESWGFGLISLSEKTTDILTLIVFICTAFFLYRRIFLARVRAITSGYDYLILLITAAPFLTGYFAYHQWFEYPTVINLHILAGEIILATIPFTKLGHMLFFFFYRFLIGNEYSFSQGTRTW
jgi:nitrate reductase gamma subunit